MWLVYLRFDGQGKTRVSHLFADNEQNAKEVVEKARKFGSSKHTPLTEYKLFYAHATIKPKVGGDDLLAREIKEYVT